MSNPEQNRPTPETENIRQAVTPEVGRVLAGVVDKRLLKPDEVVPQEDSERFKTWLVNKTEKDINYDPLQKLSQESRKTYYSEENKQKREEEARKAAEAKGESYQEKSDMDKWRDAVSEHIKSRTEEDNPDREEFMTTLKSIGIEVDKENAGNELSGKIDTFYEEYFDGKSDVEKFVANIAKDCRDGDGPVDMDKLESRLHAVKGLLTSFGQKEDGIPQLLEAHAKGQAILSQDEEKKKTAAEATWEQVKQPADEATKELFKKLAPQEDTSESKPEPEPSQSDESKTQKEPESSETQTDKTEPVSEAENRFREITEGDKILSSEEISEIKSKLKNKDSLPAEEVSSLQEKLNQSRFRTEDLNQMRIFSDLFFKDNEEASKAFLGQLEGDSAEDQAAGKPIIYVMELSRGENGVISPRPIVIEKRTPEPQPEEPKAQAEEKRDVQDVFLPEPAAQPETTPAESTPDATPPAPPAAEPNVTIDEDSEQTDIKVDETATHDEDLVTVKEINGDTAKIQVNGGANDGGEKEVPLDELLISDKADVQNAEEPTTKPEEEVPQMNEKFKIGDDIVYMDNIHGKIVERDGDNVKLKLNSGVDFTTTWEKLLKNGEPGKTDQKEQG